MIAQLEGGQLPCSCSWTETYECKARTPSGPPTRAHFTLLFLLLLYYLCVRVQQSKPRLLDCQPKYCRNAKALTASLFILVTVLLIVVRRLINFHLRFVLCALCYDSAYPQHHQTNLVLDCGCFESAYTVYYKAAPIVEEGITF